MALKITQLSHREIDENAINAGQRVDGAVTPHVLTCEERLSNVNRAGEGGEEGGSADGITIAACLVTRVDPAFSWVTHVETTNRKPNTVGVCWP